MNTGVLFILEQCPGDLKEDMGKALEKYRYPQVFQTGYYSSDFKMDNEAKKYGWTSALQQEYYHIHFDAMDTDGMYDWA